MRAHIDDLRRSVPEFEKAPLLIFVERNLGFEAEHLHRALRELPLVRFYRDEAAQRTGVLTTDVIKYAAMTLTNVFLREQRLCIWAADALIARDPNDARRRLREQLEIYSFQFKSPENVFQKERVALSGKVCHTMCARACRRVALIIWCARRWAASRTTSSSASSLASTGPRAAASRRCLYKNAYYKLCACHTIVWTCTLCSHRLRRRLRIRRFRCLGIRTRRDSTRQANCHRGNGTCRGAAGA